MCLMQKYTSEHVIFGVIFVVDIGHIEQPHASG